MVPKQYATRPRCAIFKHTMYKYFSNLTKMVPIHQILKLILIPLRKSPIFDPFVVRENVKIWLKMFWISLSKLGFTLKEIDLSVFSSLQRHFLHLPDFLLFSRASAPAKRAQRSPIRKRKLKPIDPKKKVQSKADHNNVYCLFITIFRLAIPAFFSKPDNMQDRRPRFLQLISFSNLSMPENLVMTSEYSDYPYRPQGRGKKKPS